MSGLPSQLFLYPQIDNRQCSAFFVFKVAAQSYQMKMSHKTSRPFCALDLAALLFRNSPNIPPISSIGFQLLPNLFWKLKAYYVVIGLRRQGLDLSGVNLLPVPGKAQHQVKLADFVDRTSDQNFRWLFQTLCMRRPKDFECFVNRLNRRTRICLLYTSPSPRDRQKSRMPSSA